MKYYKQIIAIWLIVLSLNIKAQDMNSFYFEANVANNLAKVGKIDSAIITYENAFKKVDYVQITYLNKIVTLAKLNKDQERINRYLKQIKIQLKGTTPQLVTIIDSLIKADQKVRKGKSLRKSKYSWECDEDPNCNKQSKKYIKSKLFADNWKKTDSLNSYFLFDLFQEYGFIGEELVGFKGYNNIIAIFTHFDLDTNNTILEPILRIALNEGKIWPIHFTQILDRHLGGKFTIQKYWTWPDRNKKKYEFSESDIPKIIKLRESIGIYGSTLSQFYSRGSWLLQSHINY